MDDLLTKGALLQICKGAKLDGPVLQILDSKRIVSHSSDRYRTFISDGEYSNSFAMMGSQLNERIANREFDKFAVVRVDNLVCNNINGKKVIILLEMSLVKSGSEVGRKLGSPVQLNADGSAPQPKNVNSNNSNGNANAAMKRPASSPASGNDNSKRASPLTDNTNNYAGNKRGSVLESRGGGNTKANTMEGMHNVMPIKGLNPYQNKWTIKARVTHKSDIRRWSNSRGEGHLFSMDLLDDTGEIRATAFKEQCDKFYNLIEVGKVFFISNCSLKAANKQYSTLNNEYEMTFRESTEVVPCLEDTGNIPTLSFDFVKISDLASLPKDSIVDLVGVIKSSSDVSTIISQRTQKELVKRDIVLVDQSLTEVSLTLWGTTAETLKTDNDTVLAIKGAKISDYNGVSLSTLSSSVVQVDPDMRQAHVLKGWFVSEGSKMETSSLTQAGMGGRGDGGMGFGNQFKTISEAKNDYVGQTNDGKPDFYSTVGVITMFQKDRALYKACGRVNDGKSCNKKVVDQSNGMYRCEKCGVDSDTFAWRIVLSLSVADATESLWVTCFQEQAELILGMSAADLGQLSVDDPDKFNEVFTGKTFKRFNFRLSVKMEFYNDEQRARHTVRSVAPIDYHEYCKRLVREIEEGGMQLPDKFDKALYI